MNQYGVPDHQLVGEAARGSASEYLTNPEWALQVKHNGYRAWLFYRPGKIQNEIILISRNGAPIKSWLTNAKESSNATSRMFLIDGEWIPQESAFIAFDLYMWNTYVWGNDIFNTRYDKLCMESEGIESLIGNRFFFTVTPTEWTTSDKERRFARAAELGGEGVVFRLIKSKYESGYRSNALKYKFWDTARAFVQYKHQATNEVSVSYFTGQIETAEPTKVPANGALLELGDVVMVEYLWADADGRLKECSLLVKDGRDISLTRNQKIRQERFI